MHIHKLFGMHNNESRATNSERLVLERSKAFVMFFESEKRIIYLEIINRL